jgi:threonine aldolase
MREELVASLHARGWYFYKHVEPDIYRLMCSWAVTERTLNQLIADLEATKNG